jgi:hypothetical protein
MEIIERRGTNGDPELDALYQMPYPLFPRRTMSTVRLDVIAQSIHLQVQMLVMSESESHGDY